MRLPLEIPSFPYVEDFRVAIQNNAQSVWQSSARERSRCQYGLSVKLACLRLHAQVVVRKCTTMSCDGLKAHPTALASVVSARTTEMNDTKPCSACPVGPIVPRAQALDVMTPRQGSSRCTMESSSLASSIACRICK